MAKIKTTKLQDKTVIRVDPERIDSTGAIGWCIVVVDRGFVWVGDVQVHGSMAYIVNGYNIKTWGAPKGLGQLAADGPQAETEIDPMDCVVVPMRAILAFVPAERGVWPSNGAKA